MAAIVRLKEQETDSLLADTPAVKATVSIGLNKSGEFSVDVPLNTEALVDVNTGNNVEIYQGGLLLIRGVLQKFNRALKDEAIITVSGRDVTDDLYKVRSLSYALFEDTAVSTILAFLLRQAGWMLGDISTMENPDALMTIDLRGEKYLINQISKLITEVSNTVYRYGDTVAEVNALDVGVFNQSSDITFYTPSDNPAIDFDSRQVGKITSLTSDVEFTERVHTLELIGGEVQDNAGVKRTVTLQDAIYQDPTIRFHAEYPVRQHWVNQSTVLHRRSAGLPGGGFISWPANTQLLGYGRVASVTRNIFVEFIIPPGILTEVTLDFSTNTGAPTGTTFLKIFKTILGTGLPDGPELGQAIFTHVPSARNRIIFSTPVRIEWDTPYLFQLGFSVPTAGANDYATLIGTNVVGYTNSLTVWLNTSVITQTPRITVLTLPDMTDGEAQTLQWTQYAPEITGSNSTQSRIRKMAVTMWGAGCAYMDTKSGLNESFQMEAIGEEIVPALGDLVYVRGQAEYAFTDPFTGDTQTYRELIEENLRVNGISISLGDEITYSFELFKGTGNVFDADEYLAMYVRTKAVKPEAGEVQALVYAPQAGVIVYPIPYPVGPNASMSDGRDAFQVTLTLPASPTNKRDVYLCGIPIPEAFNTAMTVEVVSHPVYNTLTGPTIRIAPKYRGWSFQDEATIRCRIIWN